jgi:hypothetical protein
LGGLLAGSAGAGDATFPALTRLLADHEGQVRVKPSSNRATASQTVLGIGTGLLLAPLYRRQVADLRQITRGGLASPDSVRFSGTSSDFVADTV